MYRLLSIAFALLLFSCVNGSHPVSKQSEANSTPIDTSFAGKIASAHKTEIFNSFETVSFQIQLYFGGTERLNAGVTLATNGTKGFFSLADSTF